MCSFDEQFTAVDNVVVVVGAADVVDGGAATIVIADCWNYFCPSYFC